MLKNEKYDKLLLELENTILAEFCDRGSRVDYEIFKNYFFEMITLGLCFESVFCLMEHIKFCIKFNKFMPSTIGTIELNAALEKYQPKLDTEEGFNFINIDCLPFYVKLFYLSYLNLDALESHPYYENLKCCQNIRVNRNQVFRDLCNGNIYVSKSTKLGIETNSSSCYLMALDDETFDRVLFTQTIDKIYAGFGGMGISVGRLSTENIQFVLSILINMDIVYKKRRINVTMFIPPFHPYQQLYEYVDKVDFLNICYFVDKNFFENSNMIQYKEVISDKEEYVDIFRNDIFPNRTIAKTIPTQVWLNHILGVLLATNKIYFVNGYNINVNQPEFVECLNLCLEIVQPSSLREIGFCNVGGVNLKNCIVEKTFDFDLLRRYTKNLGNLLFCKIEVEAKRKDIGVSLVGLGQVLQFLNFEVGNYKKFTEEILDVMNKTLCHMKLGEDVGFEIEELVNFEEGFLNRKLKTLTWIRFVDRNFYFENCKDGAIFDTTLCLAPSANSALYLNASPSCYFMPPSEIIRTKQGNVLRTNDYIVRDWWNEIGFDLKMPLKWKLEKLRDYIKICAFSKDEKFKYFSSYDLSIPTQTRMAIYRNQFLSNSESVILYMKESKNQSETVEKIIEHLRYGSRYGLKTLLYYLLTKDKEPSLAFTKCGSQACGN